MGQTFNPKKCKTCGKEYSPGGPRQEYCSAACNPTKKSGSRTKKSSGQSGEPVLHAKRKAQEKRPAGWRSCATSAKATKPGRALVGLLDKLQELSSTLQHIFDERESASLFLDELLSKAKSGKYDAADLKKRLRELYIRVAHQALASDKDADADLASLDAEAAKGGDE